MAASTPRRFFTHRTSAPRAAIRAPQEPRRAGAGLALWSGSRALLWGLLAVGLFGTAASATTLPYPVSLLLLMPSMVGGLCASLAMCFRLFIACAAAVDAVATRARRLGRPER
ncbi:MAG: hypothetical protein HOV68_13095 [Streptomycetaceae bacterium]|nr:hypothetical protein [Streptomycetaceae bacterium]